jgi:hypothetical protein
VVESQSETEHSDPWGPFFSRRYWFPASRTCSKKKTEEKRELKIRRKITDWLYLILSVNYLDHLVLNGCTVWVIEIFISKDIRNLTTCSRTLLGKLRVALLVKKCVPGGSFSGVQMAGTWSWPLTSSLVILTRVFMAQCLINHRDTLTLTILILSSYQRLRPPNFLPLQVSWPKFCMHFHLPMRAACSVHPVLPGLMTILLHFVYELTSLRL